MQGCDAVLAVTDVDSYVELRVDEQIASYYRPRATTYARRASRLRLAGDALGIIAAVAAGVASALSSDDIAAWVPVVTTVSAALVAHVAASRLDHQVIEFSRTAEQLDWLRNVELGRLGPAAFIDACEGVISVENQGWMAKWESPSAGVA